MPEPPSHAVPLPRRFSRIFAVLLLAGLTGCAQFPELDDTFDAEARRAGYPDLVPAETLRADLPQTRIAPQTRTALEVRIAGLRARAARLRGQVIDRPSRARLSQPVTIAEPS
ncbi:hypothetical protein [Roseovarius aestuariivivens]|uniref:hypothetical protein n=1 Tax=Roseovarius aestuariivivens TaxID=1888910 RepID=UPI001FDABB95|nr:hypothetical protein [Roseovarius aestuariivivens]